MALCLFFKRLPQCTVFHGIIYLMHTNTSVPLPICVKLLVKNALWCRGDKKPPVQYCKYKVLQNMSARNRKTEWTTHGSCSMIVPIEPVMDQAFICSEILPEKQQKQKQKAMDSVPVQINYFLTVLIWGVPWASTHPLIPSGDMNMWLFSATLHLTPSPVFMLCNTGPQIAMWDWYTHTQSSKRYLMLLWFDEHAAFFFFFFYPPRAQRQVEEVSPNTQGHTGERDTRAGWWDESGLGNMRSRGFDVLWSLRVIRFNHCRQKLERKRVTDLAPQEMMPGIWRWRWVATQQRRWFLCLRSWFPADIIAALTNFSLFPPGVLIELLFLL